MGSDLIAWIVAVALGAIVVIVGLRRNLADTTRNSLPWFGEALGQATASPGLFDDAQMNHPFSSRQRR
jgi:hypothetical protein